MEIGREGGLGAVYYDINTLLFNSLVLVISFVAFRLV